MYTLDTVDRPAVTYAIDPLSSNSMKSANPNSGFHEAEYIKCLDTSDQNPCKNQGGNVVVQPMIYDTTQITSPMNYSNPKDGGQHQASVGVFMGGQGVKAGGIAWSDQVAPTLKSVMSGGNTIPDVVLEVQGENI